MKKRKIRELRNLTREQLEESKKDFEKNIEDLKKLQDALIKKLTTTATAGESEDLRDEYDWCDYVIKSYTKKIQQINAMLEDEVEKN